MTDPFFCFSFLLAANCPLLSECLSSANSESDSDSSAVVVILPDVSRSTLTSMLKCTLNHAVRWDTLSVNEQQVMELLGFNLERASPAAADGGPDYESEATKRPPRMEVTIVQEEEDGGSGEESSGPEDLVAVSDGESEHSSAGHGRTDAEATSEAASEAAAEAFGDIPIRSGDIKGDVDAISMMSVEGGNLLFQSGAKRSARGGGSRSSSSDLSIPCLANVPSMVDKSVGTDENENFTESIRPRQTKGPSTFRCAEPGCGLEFSRRQHLEQHAALHAKEPSINDVSPIFGTFYPLPGPAL